MFIEKSIPSDTEELTSFLKDKEFITFSEFFSYLEKNKIEIN